MRTPLYLDTARLGLMCPRAEDALYSLNRMACREGLSYHFDVLLRNGFDAWPERLRNEFGGLSCWQGVPELKSAVRVLLRCRPEDLVLLATRSAQLMSLAARLLFLRCRRVLTTDLEWPGYLRILEAERARLSSQVVSLPLRDLIQSGSLTASEVAGTVVSAYRAGHCDGLFLSAVSYDGIRLPYVRISHDLRAGTLPRFVVLDGAQAIGHTPVDLGSAAPDFFLAGCHKWLGAHLPLGIAVCPQAASRSFVQAGLAEMQRSGDLDDPIEAFTRSLEEDSVQLFAETVSVSCLFAARAALAGHLEEGVTEAAYSAQLGNAREMMTTLRGSVWEPVPVHDSLRSGILLLRPTSADVRKCSGELMRERLLQCGVAATCYESHVVRLSMPKAVLASSDLELVAASLRCCS